MSLIIPIKHTNKYVREELVSCIFCGLERKGSKEHIFPLWLQRHLDITEEILAPARLGPAGAILEQRKSLSLKSFYATKICKVCNEGWMSALEQSTMPILKPLLDGSRKLNDLSDKDKAILSQWIVKTTFVLNTGNNFYKNVPLSHFKHLAHDGIPSNVIVLATEIKDKKKFNWTETNNWMSGGDPTSSQVLASNAYKTTLQLNNILFAVAYWPEETWFYYLREDLHIPIWIRNSKITWHIPQPKQPFLGELSATAHFLFGLWIIPSPNDARF